MFSLVNTLQRYGYGSVTQLKDLIADTIGTTGLPKEERVAAAKALTHAFGAQIVLAGALGLPGAAIVAALVEKLFGWDLKQSMRELWYSLSKGLGADDPLAVMIANTAQNGVGGQFMGVDLSSRFALNSFVGFDSFEGFNTTNLLDALASLVERLIQGTKYTAQGKLVKAAGQALPPSMTPMVDVASQMKEYGSVGMRTADGKLIRELTTPETIRYAAGVRPYWYRQYRDLQQYKTLTEAAHRNVGNQRVDSAASALRAGDNSQAMSWVQDYMRQTPSADPRDALRSVVDRALVQTNGQDLLSTSIIGNQEKLTRAAQTFGNAVQRQSEMQLLMQREKLNAQTGYLAGEPVSSQDIQRAQMVDALVESKGLTRSEAMRVVIMMGF